MMRTEKKLQMIRLPLDVASAKVSVEIYATKSVPIEVNLRGTPGDGYGVEGSEIIVQPKQHVQDPYSFRCIPQVHGATKDAINHVASVLLTGSVTTNTKVTAIPSPTAVFTFFDTAKNT